MSKLSLTLDERRNRIRSQAKILQRVSEDDQLWNQLSTAYIDADGERFRGSLEGIPLPDDFDAQEWCFWICEQIEKGKTAAVWGCTWISTGEPFNLNAERAELETALGIKLTDSQWNDYLELLQNKKLITCGNQATDSDPINDGVKNISRCDWICFGRKKPVPRPKPFPTT